MIIMPVNDEEETVTIFSFENISFQSPDSYHILVINFPVWLLGILVFLQMSRQLHLTSCDRNELVSMQ